MFIIIIISSTINISISFFLLLKTVFISTHKFHLFIES